MPDILHLPAIAAAGATDGQKVSLVFLILTILIAVMFDFTNGFHDTANAVATSVSTRVLSPRVAIVMAALLAAIGWNLLTWYFGLPSSSSHALIGGLVGAAIIASPLHFGALKADGILKIVLSLILSPAIGLIIAYLIGLVLLWIFRGSTPQQVTGVSRWLQRLSAAFVAFSHGSNDAQKTMGVITAAIVSYESATTATAHSFAVPMWVIVLSATAMGLGTSFGGWRIIRTMGMRVVKLRPVDGFAAETAAASVIVAASHLGLPVSTTHVIAGSVMGVGARQRLSAVRWGVAGNMVVAWILTGPITAIIAALLCLILQVVKF